MKNVLIVDDEPALLRIFKMELDKSLELNVDFAESGMSALAMAIKKTYDIILTDITMPQMDGIEFLTQLKGLGRSAPCTVIISGLPKDMHCERLKGLGVKKYFQKPFNVKDIVKDILVRC